MNTSSDDERREVSSTRTVNSMNIELSLLYDCVNHIQSIECCSSTHQLSEYNSSTYISKDATKKIPSTPTNRLLDFLTACFWKCSPGCQEIPKKCH